MVATTHLRALQALEMAVRSGSLKSAAEALGITPAAVGQRIRALEDYLGTDLLVRGRSGLRPTPELDAALGDLHRAFAALDRVTETLDFQRVTEIHIVAEPDWAELWLLPRLPGFRAKHPQILFCINGEGDVPVRLGAPDIRVEYATDGPGEDLYVDRLLPVTGPDNLRRLGDWDAQEVLEGMPLLHLQQQRDSDDHPGWPDWIARFGDRRAGADRGVHYRHARIALEAVRENVGFLVCGLSLILDDLDRGRLVLPYPADRFLDAPAPYRMRLRDGAGDRPQIARFRDWLRDEARATAERLAGLSDQAATVSAGPSSSRTIRP